MKSFLFCFLVSLPLPDTTKLGIKQQSWFEVLDMRRALETKMAIRLVLSTCQMSRLASLLDLVLEHSDEPSFVHIGSILLCSSQPPGLERGTPVAQPHNMVSAPN